MNQRWWRSVGHLWYFVRVDEWASIVSINGVFERDLLFCWKQAATSTYNKTVHPSSSIICVKWLMVFSLIAHRSCFDNSYTPANNLHSLTVWNSPRHSGNNRYKKRNCFQDPSLSYPVVFDPQVCLEWVTTWPSWTPTHSPPVAPVLCNPAFWTSIPTCLSLRCEYQLYGVVMENLEENRGRRPTIW